MTVSTMTAVAEIEDDLMPLIPNLCTKKALSTAPGDFVPVLKHILEKYEIHHQEHSVAAYLASIKHPVTETLPKLFALYPIPSTKWRFVDLNTTAISSLLSLSTPHKSYDENLDFFNSVFYLDRYNWNR